MVLRNSNSDMMFWMLKPAAHGALEGCLWGFCRLAGVRFQSARRDCLSHFDGNAMKFDLTLRLPDLKQREA
jgi:hypothetical protein